MLRFSRTHDISVLSSNTELREASHMSIGAQDSSQMALECEYVVILRVFGASAEGYLSHVSAASERNFLDVR